MDIYRLLSRSFMHVKRIVAFRVAIVPFPTKASRPLPPSPATITPPCATTYRKLGSAKFCTSHTIWEPLMGAQCTRRFTLSTSQCISTLDHIENSLAPPWAMLSNEEQWFCKTETINWKSSQHGCTTCLRTTLNWGKRTLPMGKRLVTRRHPCGQYAPGQKLTWAPCCRCGTV